MIDKRMASAPKRLSTGSRSASMSDDELIKLSVKDLNRLLKSLSPDERLNIKRRRRILKNRGYAATCRTKRLSTKEELEIEKDTLEREINQLEHENEIASVKLNSVKEQIESLETYISNHKANKDPNKPGTSSS